MASVTTKAQGLQLGTETAAYLFDDWFDPIETGLREQVRSFIEELIRGELDTALARPRYARQVEPEGGAVPGLVGHRHGSRTRTLTGTFGAQQISVPRARIERPDGTTTEWKSKALRAYQRRTVAADALIASTYLAGTNTRRVRRALVALFGGAVGKDVVSRTWRKVKTDWEAWNRRDLAALPIVRLILDGTVVRVRLDRKATSISLLVVLGVCRDGQKVLLAVKNMGGESEAAWRVLLDDLVARGLTAPELVIVDGAPGLEKALAALWPQLPTLNTRATAVPSWPLGKAFEEMSVSFERFCLAAALETLGATLESDVAALCGPRHARGQDRRGHRWGARPGSSASTAARSRLGGRWATARRIPTQLATAPICGSRPRGADLQRVRDDRQ